MNERTASLCQTNQSSCVACCIGTYINAPQSELTAIFNRRAQILRDSDGPLDYYERSGGEEKDVPFCKFLGYLDEEASFVGCVIHPEHVNTGEDLRQDDRINRSVCSRHSCKTNDVFRNADETTRRAILEFIIGMDWYTFSHFMRRDDL